MMMNISKYLILFRMDLEVVMKRVKMNTVKMMLR